METLQRLAQADLRGNARSQIAAEDAEAALALNQYQHLAYTTRRRALAPGSVCESPGARDQRKIKCPAGPLSKWCPERLTRSYRLK